MDAPALQALLHLRPLFLYHLLHLFKFLFGDDGLVLPFHDDAVKLPVVLRPFLFEVVRHIFLPVFQLAAVEAVFQDMADGGIMPQAVSHRREVAVFFKPPLALLAAFTRMEVFFDSFCARVTMMVSLSSPSSSFMVHMPSSVKYTSMPILFNNLVCWTVNL